MIKLKNLLDGKEKIRILIRKEEKEEFLQYAKENSCLWSNGEIISPKEDNVYSDTIGITGDFLIHCVSGYCDGLAYSNRSGYRFSDLKKDVARDVLAEEKMIRDEHERKAYEEYLNGRRLFKEKCRINRQISAEQLKNQRQNDRNG